MQNFKNQNAIQNDDNAQGDTDTEDEQNEETDNDDATNDYEDEDDTETEDDEDETPSEAEKNTQLASDSGAFNDNEFIDIEGDGGEETIGQLKKPGGGNKRRKNKNKKKGQSQQHEIASQAANLLVIQPIEHQFTQLHQDAEQLTHKVKPIRTKVKPLKQKRRKRKKKGQTLDDDVTVVVEQQPSSDHLGLGLLEELSEVDLLSGGGKRKKHPMKYGRSNGGVCLNNFCAPFPDTMLFCSSLVHM